MQITGFLAIDETLTTSGQPTAAQFQDIANLGFKTVINLALPESDNALANEGEIVTGLGMNYIHIPVQWQQPEPSQFELFRAVMNSQYETRTWVHCALNMRVAVFVYLYRILQRGVPEPVARQKLHAIWEPDGVWAEFITRMRQ